jgi:hypothetical protein
LHFSRQSSGSDAPIAGAPAKNPAAVSAIQHFRVTLTPPVRTERDALHMAPVVLEDQVERGAGIAFANPALQ